MIDTKNCVKCGTAFSRNPHYSQKQWDLSQFCGRECSSRRFAAQNPMDGFFSHVSIDPITRCWDWVGAKDEGGYGMFRGTRAHRHIYTEAVSDIPGDEWVLHRCDNPGCVNPTHLFLGNRQDNVDDMHLKGRANKACGEAVGNARLTVAEVIAIRSDDRTQEQIARDYGVAQTTISAIKRNMNWGSL
jgi:hypothetical protein